MGNLDKKQPLRHHFQKHAHQPFNIGQMIRLGLPYYIRYMNENDLSKNLALQAHVLDNLKKADKTHYIIKKDESYLRKFLMKGNAIIGTFLHKGTPGLQDRLAAHMLIVYPQTEKESGLADPTLLPDKDMETISVVSNILVHDDFRGNKLMQIMMDEWLKIAAADGKQHAIAEICVDNEFSWGVFVDCGFSIYAHGYDARDGSHNVYVHKPLDRKFLYSNDPGDTITLQLFDNEKGVLIESAHERLKDLLNQGFHGVHFDRKTRGLLLKKCTGIAPIPKANIPAPGNDNIIPK
ncbi:MAG: hypothetical protein CO093_09700 [Alphaproteobacteria bacterium CG_4_9_14_3_um_filter_47_13]|nr:MAG: hypothetical protein CO093_09700 [Alphaproteobacteria bacterium CG_4_9_14_3_um_filter_47_13]